MLFCSFENINIPVHCVQYVHCTAHCIQYIIYALIFKQFFELLLLALLFSTNAHSAETVFWQMFVNSVAYYSFLLNKSDTYLASLVGHM